MVRYQINDFFENFQVAVEKTGLGGGNIAGRSGNQNKKAQQQGGQKAMECGGFFQFHGGCSQCLRISSKIISRLSVILFTSPPVRLGITLSVLLMITVGVSLAL